MFEDGRVNVSDRSGLVLCDNFLIHSLSSYTD